MLLFPKKTKFKKSQKQKRRLKLFNFENKYNYPKIFHHALKIKKSFRVFSFHIETLRTFIKRKIKKKSYKKIIFGFFPDLAITKKSSGLRMGKGKGNFFAWTNHLNSGRIFCELSFLISKIAAQTIINKSMKKLPVKCKYICRKKFYN
jgi:ribosomal protein L16